jgi:stage III sporulation protein SpoIIIAA
MFWLNGTREFISPEEIELESRLQFVESKQLSEGSCAYINNLSDERVMIHWFSKEDTRKLVQTAELKGPMFINTAHPVTLVNLGDKSAVVDYIDLNTVIEHYKGI